MTNNENTLLINSITTYQNISSSNIIEKDLHVGNDIDVSGVLSANSFLIMNQFEIFPENKIDMDLLRTVWASGILAPNGKIYCVPFEAKSVLIINPIMKTLDTITIPLYNNVNKWAGGILASNGKIYCCPKDSTSILIIDPTTNTVDTTTITGVPSGNPGGWHSSVLHTDGKIYCMPYATSNVLIIDPTTNTVDTTNIKELNHVVNTFDSSNKWNDGESATTIYMDRVYVIKPLNLETNLSGIFDLATYSDSLKTLTCPGATFTNSLNIGDNVIITTALENYTGYVQTITNDTNVVFAYYLGESLSTPINLSSGQIINLQKMRKIDMDCFIYRSNQE